MALKVVWTKQAEKGLLKVIRYLEEEWSSKEILRLEKNINIFSSFGANITLLYLGF